jgi:hypothetical protein
MLLWIVVGAFTISACPSLYFLLCFNIDIAYLGQHPSALITEFQFGIDNVYRRFIRPRYRWFGLILRPRLLRRAAAASTSHLIFLPTWIILFRYGIQRGFSWIAGTK